ncbi:MAG: M55 family metallopeptidase [Chloroflexota bacterium]|nr:M55 family metallopeptidase [Chloroflexota bacterium]
MRILISADAEGVTGITNTNELLFGRPHYEFMRQMMTDDVNAAIVGAFDGGATEVVVNDSHWTMTNVQIERLDPRADLIKGFHKPLCMVEGVDAGIDGLFFLGYHCRTGDSDGVGNETILGREIVEIRMNGKPVGESEINAAVAGHFGVPVLFASGDDLYERELRETLPGVEFGLTKHALGRWTARCLPIERSRANIRTAAQRAVERGREGVFKPYRLDGPVDLEVVFSSTSEAQMGSLVPGSERRAPRTVAFRADDAVAAWKGFFAVLLLGWTATDEVYG